MPAPKRRDPDEPTNTIRRELAELRQRFENATDRQRTDLTDIADRLRAIDQKITVRTP